MTADRTAIHLEGTDTMANTQEMGWNPKYDEGMRLISTHSNFSGIRAKLKLPREFNCDVEQAYFNFYLGINFMKSGTEIGGVEAGVSHTFKPDPQSGVKRAHWRLFVNPQGNPIVAQFYPGDLVTLQLDMNHPTATLSLGSWDGVSFWGRQFVTGNAKGKAGFVKMVAAIHESHGFTLDRTTRFDRATFAALQVRKEGRTDWLNIDKIEGLYRNCERPPSMHCRIQTASQTSKDFSVQIYNVQCAGSGAQKARAKAP
jgi:hypothetical protein